MSETTTRMHLDGCGQLWDALWELYMADRLTIDEASALYRLALIGASFARWDALGIGHLLSDDEAGVSPRRARKAVSA